MHPSNTGPTISQSRQMFHTSRHFYDVTFSQIYSMNIAGLCFVSCLKSLLLLGGSGDD